MDTCQLFNVVSMYGDLWQNKRTNRRTGGREREKNGTRERRASVRFGLRASTGAESQTLLAQSNIGRCFRRTKKKERQGGGERKKKKKTGTKKTGEEKRER